MTKKLLESAIVRVHDTGGNVVGAGFLIAERYVLTCAHVVASALDLPGDTADLPEATLQIDFPLLAAGEMLAARVCQWQLTADVAGLQLLGWAPPGAAPVQLVTADDLWGHPFRAHGFPSGRSQGVWTSGILRGRQADGWVQLESIETTGYKIAYGFSGTPVWDEVLQGVVGIIVAAETDEQIKAAYLLPTDMLARAWPERIHQSSAPISGKSVKSHTGDGTQRFQPPRGTRALSGREQLSALRELLVERFSISELHDLCFGLGVDYDDLPGQEKTAKARELILYLMRRSRLEDLIKEGRRQRPELPWETIS